MIKKSPTIEKILEEEKIENVECPICAADGIAQNDLIVGKVGYPNVKFQNVICKTCGLIRINPRMTQKGFDRFYKEAFFEYLDPYSRAGYVEEIEKTTDDKVWTPTRKNQIPYILPWVKEGGRVLDIGAGFGAFLYYLKKAKNTIGIGLEPDPESLRVGVEKIGMDLRPDTIEEFFEKDNSKFDFVILSQTYEHLLSPLKTLRDIKERLAPEGVIYIGVPNGYKFKAPFYLLFQLAHTYNYTPFSFKRLAELADLKILNMRDPNGYPLEILLCHKDANYPTELPVNLNVGKDYKKVLFEMNKVKVRDNSRIYAKNFLQNTLGPTAHKKIRNFIDSLISFVK